MGIFKDLVTSQLIDVIEWTDDSANTMVYKYDMNGKEIMMGAQLTVRESQAGRPAHRKHFLHDNCSDVY